MRTSRLLARSLAYYWRTNAAVVLGVATAVSVLAGALLVGDSVRASLRDLVFLRLGNADHSVSTPRFFRESLAGDLAALPGFLQDFDGSCPLMAIEGVATHEESGRRASDVFIYGVDDRFWTFHGRAQQPLEGREVLISEGLASELAAAPGSTLLLRVEQPSAIPAGSLFGSKEDRGRTLRVTIRAVLSARDLGEFSVRPQQQAVRALFLPLQLLQRSLEQEGKVNTLLLSERPEKTVGAETIADFLKQAYALEDLGLRLRALEGPRLLSLENESALIDASLAQAAQATASALGMGTASVLSYLANTIRAGDRAIPYSLVSALGPEVYGALSEAASTVAVPSPMLLNEWAARDLGVRPGAPVSIDYYVWEEEGRLLTRTAEFQVAGILPLKGRAADPDLVPEYPGITESTHLSDWDPPFPIDLRRVRPRDEEYWERYRTTPKAFIPLAKGQELWRHRLGELTSIRVFPPAGMDLATARVTYERSLKSALDPRLGAFAVEPVRAEGLQAAEGATDFGEYFVYFSSFLVAAALLLTGLFFRLGVEQRLREIGLLRAVGFPDAALRRQFVGEGLVLAAWGCLLGIVGAAAYAGLMILGLRTLWVEAVGTRLLGLHLAAASLAWGTAGGIASALLCVAWTLRGLRRIPPRSLMSGAREVLTRQARHRRVVAVLGVAAGISSALLLLAARRGWLGEVASFFASGLLLLGGVLSFLWLWLNARGRSVPGGPGMPGVLWLGFRNASYRPGRSLLCVALIASATFVIVAVGAFRQDEGSTVRDRRSGAGGYPLLAESLLPLHHDPNTAEGRQSLNLVGPEALVLEGVAFARFRLRPGDDASCLNLYRPQNPRILAPTPEFVREGRFAFQDSLAQTPEERANPWLLLEGEHAGVVPVIADANSMTYVLHGKLGEELVIDRSDGPPLRLRLVGALRDSLFQSALLMGEKDFLRLFPREGGYRFFLLDAPPGREVEAAGFLESRLADLGLDVLPTADRLAGFQRVENTYLSTFQTLGALGLVLGTLGLATVLLRNALERRRELALLRAVGYEPRHISLLVLAENGLLLAFGLLTGTGCALLAIAPTVLARGGRFPTVSLIALLLAVALTGILVSRLAVLAINRSPLLAALRAE